MALSADFEDGDASLSAWAGLAVGIDRDLNRRAGLFSAATRRLVWWLSAAYLIANVIVLLLPLGPRLHIDLEAIFLLPPIIAALVATLHAARRGRGRERLFWQLWVLTTAALLTGMLFRAAMAIAHGRHPGAGSLEDIAYLVAFTAQVPVTILFADAATVTRTRRARSILDFFAILLMILGITYLAVFDPLDVGGESVTLIENLVFTVFPVLSFAFVAYVWVFKRGHWFTWERFIFALLVSSAVGMFLTEIGMPLGLYGAGTTMAGCVNVIWAVGFLCLVQAVIWRFSDTTPASGLTPIGELSELPGLVISICALAVLPALFVGHTVVTDAVRAAVIIWSAALLAMVVVARSIVYSHEVVALRALATIDPLTGLGNRRAFRERLVEVADQHDAGSRPLALCVVDIRAFEALNLRLGYKAGDEVLRSFALTVASIIDGAGEVYRIGGDDFAVLLPDFSAADAAEQSLAIAAAAAGLVAGEIVEVVCGIATLPEHTEDTAELLRLAEGAAYWAKVLGSEQIVIYDADLVEALDARQHVARVSADTQARMIEALAAAVDARDSYTEEHSRRVAMHASELASRFGLSAERLELLHSAALLHDIGKVGVSDAILLKPAALSNDERKMAERHSELGERILQRSAPTEMCSWVRWHHERWDGHGYPDGLRREEAPVEARILCLCDSYDAMRSDRPYRPAMGRRKACEELRRCAGSQFDPGLVALFIDYAWTGEDD